MKKYRIPKLIGLALLTMITLVVFSILEVTIYSYLINPGRDAQIYDDHANLSAPWISCIFGFIVFFLVVRHWCKKNYSDLFRLAILYPLVYICIDLIILFAFEVDWDMYLAIFIKANGAKFIGSLVAYYFYKPKT